MPVQQLIFLNLTNITRLSSFAFHHHRFILIFKFDQFHSMTRFFLIQPQQTNILLSLV